MSRKRLIALIMSLAVIFGLGFAGYRAMNHTDSQASNIYSTKKQSGSASSASASMSSEASGATASEQAVEQSNDSKAGTNHSNEQVKALTGNVKQSKTAQADTARSGTSSKIKAVRSQSNQSTDTAKQTATCSLVVRGPIKSGNHVLLSKSAITIHSGDTVGKVLIRVAKASHVAVSYQGNGTTLYVRGIAGLFEFDKGSGSGWLYAVNGKFPGYSSGKYRVKKGDKIQWLYTANLGKDRDAPRVSQR